LVEHVIRNDGVTGSSPVCGTNSPHQEIDAGSQLPTTSGIHFYRLISSGAANAVLSDRDAALTR
jgi:hypothetical protein